MVGSGAVAINHLLDAVFTVDGTTAGDDGASTRTTSGAAATIFADRVIVSSERRVSDHSAGQQLVAHNRTNKIDWTITVETKLQKLTSAALLGKLLGTAGVVIRFVATATGCNITGTGIVTSFTPEYDGPSTLRFTIASYGTDLTITTT